MSRPNKYTDTLYENSPLEFETLINNLNEWENNPIEASRHCFKHLYNIIRYQQKKIEIIDNQKASNNDLHSGLNTKINITDFMNTLNEINQNIELRPAIDQIQFYLNEKISKNEIKDLLKSKLSLEEIKSYINNGDLKINTQSIIEDLNRNFVNFKNLSDILSTKADKENVLNLLNQKPNKKDLEIINNELTQLSDKYKGIDDTLNKIINNIDQQINNVNNDLNNNKVDTKDFINVVNKLNNFESKINKDSNNFNNAISDLEQKINEMLNKYELIEKNIRMYDDNFKEISNKEKDDFISNAIENFENKVNLVYNDINKIHSLLEEKVNKYEIESINLKIKEIYTKTSLFSSQKYFTPQDFENFYNNICDDIHQKFIDMQTYTKDFLKKFDNDIIQNLDTKASNEEMNKIKMDINQLKYLVDQKGDLNIVNNIEDILNNINQNYINKNDYENFLEICQKDIQEMKNDIVLKSNIDETLSYLKDKADINDVNTALNQIHDELDIKLSVQDFDVAMNNQNKINSALVQNNQIGIWVWESGVLKNNHNVPWEIQKINNYPENFIWNKDSDTIVVKHKGIYLCNLGFFMSNNTFIQLYVNGEMILSKTNNKSECDNTKYTQKYEDNLKYNKIKESVTGINIKEFLFLQEKSRITVSYDGSDNVMGFFELKMIC